MTGKISFIVTVPAPEVYSKTDVRDFIREAVQCWGGQRHPEDELFDLCRDATVRPARDNPR